MKLKHYIVGFVIIIIGFFLLFIIWIWPIINSLNYGDALPLITSIGVPIGILLWVFIKDQDRKQEEKRRKRKERKFWRDDE